MAQIRGRIVETWEDLLEIVRNYHETESPRARAAGALGQLADARAFEPLLSTALRDLESGITVHEAAIDALHQMDAERAVQSFVRALSDPDAPVRSSAAFALGKLGARQVTDSLIAALQDPEWPARSAAASALGELNADRAVQPLMQTTLEHQDDFQVTEAAYTSLGRLGTHEAIEFLLSVLNDRRRSQFERRAAAKGLGKSRDNRAVEPLIAVLENADNDAYVRKDAALALGNIGDKRAVAILITVMETEGWPLNQAATEALSEIGDEEPIARLKDTFEGLPRESEWAANALAQIGSARALAPLAAALTSSTDRDIVRRNAAAALASRGRADQVVALLIPALRDRDGWVRLFAAYGLERIADPRAVPALIERLSDTWGDEEALDFGERRVGEAAADALERIGTEEALAAVRSRYHQGQGKRT